MVAHNTAKEKRANGKGRCMAVYFTGVMLFFRLLKLSKSRRLLKSFFRIKPTPCVFRELRDMV